VRIPTAHLLDPKRSDALENPVEYEAIKLEVSDDAIATLTLNRPEVLNAWNGVMAFEFAQAIRALDLDDAVRAVVVTGAGRAFCAGADLSGGQKTFSSDETDAAGNSAQEKKREASFEDAFWPFMMRKPVIAAINGHAIGVGITLPMTCDVRYVAEDAKLQFAFTRRGLLPELGSHAIVPRVVGLSNAADLMLTGRIFKGREAAELGIASKALPADEVLPTALEHAREYLLAAPASVAIAKRLLWESIDPDITRSMKREAKHFKWTAEQPDSREGILSFMEKRAPVWKLRPSQDLPEEI
jgi:enoyl-CoA hydratase/carnithine racemase